MPLMLEVMRKHSKSFLIYLLFGIIILVFIISFGPGSECSPQGETLAAEVNGQRVPITEFENIYNHDPRYRYRDRRKDTVAMRQAAMDELIEREVLAQAALRLGLRMPDNELAKEIRKFQWFHKQGKFDKEYYKRMVNGVMNSSIPAFEERLRKQLLGAALRGVVWSSVRLSEAEVLSQWREDNDKVELEFVEFSPSKKAKTVATITPDQVKEWKDKNRKKLEEHWKTKRFLYFARKQYEVRQIALKLPPKAVPAVRDPIKKRMEKIRKELDKEKDFAKLAAKYSEHPSKAKGGSLGLIERKEMPSPEFRKVALETGVGKISRVFCDTQYCRVIKVEKTRERKLAELEDEISRDLLKQELTEKVARAEADELLKKLKASPTADLKALAPKRKLSAAEKKKAKEKRERERKLREMLRKRLAKIQGAKLPPEPKMGEVDEETSYGTTGLFARARNYLIPKIGVSKELMKKVFTLQKGAVVDKPFKVGGKLFVIRVKDRPAVAKPNDEKLAETRQRLLMIKKARVLQSWLDDLRKSARSSVNRRVLRPPNLRTEPAKDKGKAPAPKKKAG